jgi:HSP20 family protein
MNATLFDPIREAVVFQQALNRACQPPRARHARPMPLDVIETAESIVVRASLPGCDKDAIEISFREGVLGIRAQAAPTVADAEKKERLLLAERVHGEISRSLTIKIPVDVDRASASYSDGVLTLTLPKSKQARAHKISVA